MKKRQFTLTEEQEAKLKTAYLDSKDANLSQKLLAVRMYGTGRTTVEIKTLLGCSRTSLMEWVHRYRQQGLAGLIDQRQGGNHFKLSPEQKEVIKAKIYQYTPAQLLGHNCATASGTHWTSADLKQLVYKQYEIIYKSPTSYRSLLQAFGMSYQRTEKIFKSKSTMAQVDFEEQLEKNC